MSFDNSRFTFDPWKDYAGVVMQQGRVQTDADWNEWLAELSRRIRAGTLDTLGHAVYPPTTPYAFKVETSVSGGNNVVRIGVGRMYVDGILVENHGDGRRAAWDPALEELSATPQPPPATLQPLDDSNSILYEAQPFNDKIPAPTGAGSCLAYLDVWRRPVTYIEDPSLIDSAIGIDTTGRLQTAWRVVLKPLPGSEVTGSVSSGAFTEGEQVVQANTGASATLLNAPTGSQPMNLGPITGTADAKSKWTGQSSGAVFTPSAAPNGQYSTIAGAVTRGTFIAGEQVTQSSTGATADLVSTVNSAGPMFVRTISGAASANDTWVGQASEAVFTPSAVPIPTTWTCATPDSEIFGSGGSGLLSNSTITSGPSGPCCLSTGTGYTGVENQFYRIQIHRGGKYGQATFKWSRENASVQTVVTGVANGSNTVGQPASVLTVQSLGRDQVLGFAAGNWIEITNQALDNLCMSGDLYQIDKVDPAAMTITLTTLLSGEFDAASLQSNSWTRITRWDQSGKIYKSDNSVYYDLDATGSGGDVNGANGIPIPSDGSELILESGIVVSFGLRIPNGKFQDMDFWTFSARTASGTIDPLTDAAPRGIHHHYAKLGIVTLGSSTGNNDCRVPWNPGKPDCGCGCCTVTVGDGSTSFGMYTSIQQAVNALPENGGEVCILPGTYYEYVQLENLSNVVIHGCEFQTHVSSPALGPAGNTEHNAASASGITAVFTVANCSNLAIRNLAIAAARDEAGILIDRPAPASDTAGARDRRILFRNLAVSTNVTLEHLAVNSSSYPALLARSVSVLKVDDCLFTMRDVAGRFPVVLLSGEDIFFERNTVVVTNEWIAMLRRYAKSNRSQKTDAAFTPGVEDATLLSNAQWAQKSPGGVQIAGPSQNVFLTENTIEGGNGNGISLGNFILLDSSGNDTGTIAGVHWQIETECSPGGGGTIPPTSGSGGSSKPTRFAAGGLIRNLHIDRNLIRNVGMCGIGPVGFFDLKQTLEVISLINVSIRSNVIARTLLRTLRAFNREESQFGYGAVSLPDVENLTIRDNSIIDFGQQPGAEVCGIFVLHGEGIEISRNQIRETRDLAGATANVETYGGMRAGIYISVVSPPAIDAATTSISTDQNSAGGTTGQGFVMEDRALHFSSFQAPTFASSLPALRMQENVVRVAVGLALSVRGTGSFSIVNNHFSTGTPGQGLAMRAFQKVGFESGANASTTGTFAGALTVAILNLGTPLEFAGLFSSFTQAFSSRSAAFLGDSSTSGEAAKGTVLFTNNICQLEARTNPLHGLSSVAIITLDQLLFANNELWVDAQPYTAIFDALLAAVTLQVMSNRLQESRFRSVLFSARTAGFYNVTTQNIATYCIEATGFHQAISQNLILDSTFCPDQQKFSTGNIVEVLKGSKQ